MLKLRPFANGTHWLDWEASNCARCTKDSLDGTKCEIQDALTLAYWQDGRVSAEIGKRMAFTPDKYVWQCGEVEWTEEWKAEYHNPKKGVSDDG